MAKKSRKGPVEEEPPPEIGVVGPLKAPGFEIMFEGSRYEAFVIDSEHLERFIAECRRDIDNMDLGEAPEEYVLRWRKKLDEMLLPPKEGKPPKINRLSLWFRYKRWRDQYSKKRKKNPKLPKLGDRDFARLCMGAETDQQIKAVVEELRRLKEIGEYNIPGRAVKWHET